MKNKAWHNIGQDLITTENVGGFLIKKGRDSVFGLLTCDSWVQRCTALPALGRANVQPQDTPVLQRWTHSLPFLIRICRSSPLYDFLFIFLWLPPPSIRAMERRWSRDLFDLWPRKISLTVFLDN